MWKVYANRVFGLLFFSLLCKTDPWINTKSPRRKNQLMQPKHYVGRITYLVGNIQAHTRWSTKRLPSSSWALATVRSLYHLSVGARNVS